MLATVQNETIVEGSKLTLLKFTADFCGPCKMMNPILENLQDEFDERGVKIVNCDIYENPELTKKFGVRSIPAFFYIKNGIILDKSIGLSNKNTFIEKIEKYL